MGIFQYLTVTFFLISMPLKRSLRSGGGAEFDWIEAEARTEIVNEAYICSKLNVDVSFGSKVFCRRL